MMEVTKVLLLAILCLQLNGANAFTMPTVTTARTATSLSAGMGMAVKSKKKAKGKNKGNKATAPFDASASLLKMERKHEEMRAKSAKVLNKDDEDIDDYKDMIVSEFVIAARSARSSTATTDLSSVFDWIPVAQLCVARPIRDIETSDGSADRVVRAAISYYCREVSVAASLGAPKFKAVPRQEMLYSVESIDSFQKHVYDHFKGGNKDDDDEGSMTKAEARKVLDLEEGASEKSDIKQAYRKLSFKLHPDRFMAVERTEEEEDVTNNQFAQVKLAYETLSSGVNDGGSWYRSLGGKERTDFVAVDLQSISEAKSVLDSVKQETSVLSLEPDLVQMFVVRNSNQNA